ncbi:MAG: restriction endonuclease [Bacillota bacterium]|nr:restriction endonuclease [Bacillota bacterium]
MYYIILSFITVYSLLQLLIIMQKVYDLLSLAYIRKLETVKLRKGFVVKEHLYFLSKLEFREWCGLFLKRTGYSDTEVADTRQGNGMDITCSQNGKKTYVKCEKSRYDAGVNLIDVETVKKFAGTMVHGGVDQGIIITIDSIDEDVLEFIKSLRPELSIRVIDGNTLVRECDSLCSNGALLYTDL